MPRRPHIALTLRLPPELHARLAAIAEREHRSLTAEVIHLLQEAAARLDHDRQVRELPRVADTHAEYDPHGGTEPGTR